MSNNIQSSIGTQVIQTINKASHELRRSSNQLSTGNKYIKMSDGLSASIQGSYQQAALRHAHNSLQTALLITSMLSSATSGIQSMKKNFSEMENFLQNLSGNVPESTRIASVPVIDQLLSQAKYNAESANHSGLKLLDGSMSPAKPLQPASTTINPQAKYTGDDISDSMLGIGGYKGKVFTISSNVADGDTVKIGGKTFTFRTNAQFDTDIKIGITKEESAGNLVAKVNSSESSGESTLHQVRLEKIDSRVYVINNFTGGTEPDVEISADTRISATSSSGGEKQLSITFNAQSTATNYIDINGVKLVASAAIDVDSLEFARGGNATATVNGIIALVEGLIDEGGANAEKLNKYEYRAGAAGELIISAKDPHMLGNISNDITYDIPEIETVEERFGATISRSFTFTFTGDATNSEIVINGITFKGAGANNYIAAGGPEYKADDAAAATNATSFMTMVSGLASDSAAAIALSNYTISRDGAAITITPKKNNSGAAYLTNNTQVTLTSSDASIRKSSDFSEFIDSDLKGKMEYKGLKRSYFDTGNEDNVQAILDEYNVTGVVLGADPKAVEMFFEIGGESYTALSYYTTTQAGVAGNEGFKSGNQIIFKKAFESGANVKTFTLYMNSDIENSLITTANQRDAYVSEIRTELEKIVLNQQRSLNTSYNDDILVNNQSIGSLDSFAVSMSSGLGFSGSDFVNKVKVAFDGDSGELKYSVSINGKDYSLTETTRGTNPLRSNRTINRGETLTLWNDDKTEFVKISVGSKDVLLTNDTNIKAVEAAWSKAIGVAKGSSSYQIGPNAEDKFDMIFEDLRWSTLTGDFQIDISTPEKTAESLQVVRDALDKVQMSLAKLAAYDKGIDSVKESLQVSVQNITSSLEQLLKTDPTEVRETMDKSLSIIQAAIAVLTKQQQALAVLDKLFQ